MHTVAATGALKLTIIALSQYTVLLRTAHDRGCGCDSRRLRGRVDDV